MNATMRKIQALVSKDFRDLVKNPTTLVVCLLPIAFMALYQFMIGDAVNDSGVQIAESSAADSAINQFMLGSGLCITVGMVGTMTVLYGIAEEKEKHTLRTLMLANVSAMQMVISKCLVCLAAIVVVSVACFFICDGPLDLLGAYLALSVFGSLPVVLFSLVLGLASRDQMTAGVFSIPVLLLAMVPMFGMANEGIEKVAHYLPTGGIYDLIGQTLQGTLTFQDALAPILVTLAWIVAGVVVFALLFKKLARDN